MIEQLVANASKVGPAMYEPPPAPSWRASITSIGFGVNPALEAKRRSRLSLVAMRRDSVHAQRNSITPGITIDDGFTSDAHVVASGRASTRNSVMGRGSINSVSSRMSENWGATFSNVSVREAKQRPSRFLSTLGESLMPGSLNTKAVPDMLPGVPSESLQFGMVSSRESEQSLHMDEWQDADTAGTADTGVSGISLHPPGKAPHETRGPAKLSVMPNQHQGMRNSSMRQGNLGKRAMGTMGMGVRISNMPAVSKQSTMNDNDTGGLMYRIWPIWYEVDDEDISKSHSTDSFEPTSSQHFDDDSDSSSDQDGAKKKKKSLSRSVTMDKKERNYCKRGMRSLMTQPSSTPRMMWDPIGFLIICYEFVAVPLDFFQLPDHSWASGMQWFMRIYWSLDCPLSFFTGYQRSDGNVEMRPKHVAKNYLVTWFPFDVLILLFDWAELAFNFDGMGAARIGKTLKTLRLLRMVRLVRLIRLRK